MNEKCQKYLDEYLSLEKGERVPFKTALHILSCAECRHVIKSLTKAEKIATEPLNISSPLTSDSITKAVQSVNPKYKPKTNRIPFAQWIFTGLTFIACILIYVIFSKCIPSIINLNVSLCFAGVIVLYCTFFVINNMDIFIKKIGAKLEKNNISVM